MSKLYVDEIHPKTAGGTITTTGLEPPLIHFYAQRDAGNVSANQVVVFNNAYQNAGNAYDTSTGIFTAPVSGLYWFGNTVLKNGGDCDVEIWIDGSPKVGKHSSRASNTHDSTSWSGVFYLNANQNIKCVVSAGTVHSGNFWSTFTGYLIG